MRLNVGTPPLGHVHTPCGTCCDTAGRAERESLASRLRVQEAHDRWVYWTRLVYEKAARVPVKHAGSDIWDEDVIPLRQPIEECE